MGAVAPAFNAAAWKVAYPEWVAISDAQALSFWNLATLAFVNDGTGPVQTIEQQTALLYLLTAHVAALSVNPDGTAISLTQPVGRVASASEGSVSVSFDVGSVSQSQAWYMQSRYGYLFWQLTAALRLARYRVAYKTMTSLSRPGYAGYPYYRSR